MKLEINALLLSEP